MEFKKFGEMSKEKIKWLEQKYRVTFPNDYKQFLLGNNGGFFYIENMNKVPLDELKVNPTALHNTQFKKERRYSSQRNSKIG